MAARIGRGKAWAAPLAGRSALKVRVEPEVAVGSPELTRVGNASFHPLKTLPAQRCSIIGIRDTARLVLGELENLFDLRHDRDAHADEDPFVQRRLCQVLVGGRGRRTALDGGRQVVELSQREADEWRNHRSMRKLEVDADLEVRILPSGPGLLRVGAANQRLMT